MVNSCQNMHTVSQFYLKSLLKHAKHLGIDESFLLVGSNNKRIALEQQDKVWQTISNSAEPLLGFEFGAQLEPADLGTLGHLLMSASNLHEVLTYLQTFYPLIGEGGLIRIEKNQTHCAVIYIPKFEIAQHLRVEAVMACLMNLGRKLTAMRLPIISVDFSFEPHKQVVESVSRFAGCEVNVNQTQTRIQIPIEALAIPLEHANSDIIQSLLPSVTEQLSQLHSTSPLQSALHFIELSPGLSRAQLAAKMELSERSLCRYLSMEGFTFANLRRDARQRQAEQLLFDNKPVEQIAELLAYSDASAFIKAFKSWTGLTPCEFKQQVTNVL